MDYQIRPLGKKCAATGADLRPGMRCWSVLVEQDGELVRLDYAAESFPGPPAGALGCWLGVVPRAAEVKRDSLDPAALMSFFEQLTEDANPVREKLRYILALLLIQKRRLRLEGSMDQGGQELLQLVGMNGEGSYEVPDFQLSDAEMRELQKELNAHLAVEYGEPSV